MPFIKISFSEANQILNDPSYINEMLKEKKINPKEADLLEILSKYSQKPSQLLLDEIRTICNESFNKDGKEAFQRIVRFLESENKRVAWILFSRHFHKIYYDDRDPLEGYNPRVSDVLTISSKYKVIK